jgi:serine/threonine-protein kinase RsbW
MSEQTTLTVRNDLSELERLGELIDAFGARNGLPTKAVFELKVAVDEVVTNVISYAYDDGGEHEIVVRLSLDAGELSIEVEDDGQPFNPLAAAEPDVDQPVEDRPIGGLGIHLARKLTDRLEYRRQGNKNVLVMRKTARST